MSAQSILMAMITPAVLISACGTLLLSTSHRIVRVIDRVHDWSARLETMARNPAADLDHEVPVLMLAQLDATARRAQLLRWSMTAYYLAVVMFVADIGVIGMMSLTQIEDTWVTVGFGVLGVALLLGGSVALIAEAHLAMVMTHREMIYLRQLGHRHLLTDPGDCPAGSAVGGRSRGIDGQEGDRAAGDIGHVSNAGQVMETPDTGH